MKMESNNKKDNLKVNLDNKDLLKSLIDVVSNFSSNLNVEEFCYKFALILEKIFLSGLEGCEDEKKVHYCLNLLSKTEAYNSRKRPF